MKQTFPSFYANYFSQAKWPDLMEALLRAFTAVVCCATAFFLPNLGQFLNFQGALTGTLITFVFPIACFLKTFGQEVPEKNLCYGILLYGVIGGSVASAVALNAMIS